MKKLMIGVVALAGGLALAASPDIDASSVSMRVEGNRWAVVQYKLTGDSAVVTFDIEHRDGEGNWLSIGVPIVSVTGDANRLVEPDASSFKEIRWNARVDWPDQSFADGSIRAKVTAWAKDSPPDYMVLDLATMERRYYASTNSLPYGGLANDHYRTNAIVLRRIHAAGIPWVMGQATNTSEAVSCVAQSSPSSAGEHWVILTNDYYMAVFETTQAQHNKLTGGGNWRSKDSADRRKPVDGISYLRLRIASEGDGSGSGIDWPTSGSTVGGDLAAIRTVTGIDFDIPTEAEWEFACRAGTVTAYYNGGEFTGQTTGTPSLTNIAWYVKNRDDSAVVDSDGKMGGLQVVGLKEPNAWGLYDMCGNASEWCKDYAAAYDMSVQPAVAPAGPVSGTARIKRGGNWYNGGAIAASSSRRSTAHTNYSVDDSSGNAVWANGYRLVCPADASVSQSAAPRQISVTFDLEEPAIVTLGAQVSTDGGETWVDIDTNVVHVAGDVNRKLSAGSGYHAMWNAELDWPGHPVSGESVRTVVRKWTEGNPPPYFVMSCADTSKRWYFTDERQIPGGVTNRLYKTEYIVMKRIYAKDIVWPMSSPSTEEGRVAGNAIGCEYPQHYVKLTNDYYMAVYPGTIRQSSLMFGNILGTGGKAKWFPSDACHHLSLRGYRVAQGQPWTYVAGAEAPVANSNLDILRTTTGLRFDLPTEAQWEFACRAGTGTARPDMVADVGDLAWYADNSDGTTHEVGLKLPNPWGLYDMFGNVTEWCRDYEGAYETSDSIADPIIAPTGPATATDSHNYRARRGGSFRSPESWIRSARRGYSDQSWTQGTAAADGGSNGANNSGYRLVIDLD